jgi:ribosomal protein S18 acetylase RimI-like enzyme
MMNQPTITWVTADDPHLDHIVEMVHHATQQPSTRCLQSAHADDTVALIKSAWQAELNDGHLIIGTTGDATIAAEFHLDRAWLRGPFGNRARAPQLWRALAMRMPESVTTYDAFPHLDAHELIIFWQSQGFNAIKTVHVMHHTDPIVDALTPDVQLASSIYRTAIATLHNQHFANTWASIDDLYADDEHHLLSIIPAENADIKGYAWWSIDQLDQSATLEFIAVDADYQRTGVASNLIYHGLAWAYSHYIHSVQLTVDDDRQGAQALYKRCGFRYKSSGQHLRWQKTIEANHV